MIVLPEPQLKPVALACKAAIYEANTAWRGKQPTPTPYKPFRTVVHCVYRVGK